MAFFLLKDSLPFLDVIKFICNTLKMDIIHILKIETIFVNIYFFLCASDLISNKKHLELWDGTWEFFFFNKYYNISDRGRFLFFLLNLLNFLLTNSKVCSFWILFNKEKETEYIQRCIKHCWWYPGVPLIH